MDSQLIVVTEIQHFTLLILLYNGKFSLQLLSASPHFSRKIAGKMGKKTLCPFSAVVLDHCFLFSSFELHSSIFQKLNSSLNWCDEI